MQQLEIMGSCPNKIIIKAKRLLNSLNMPPVKPKKLSGMKRAYSIRINKNYRILLSDDNQAYIGSHKQYEKKIKNLKKGRH